MISSAWEDKGMTLVEVVVVLSIFAILVGAFGTGLMRWLPNHRFGNYVMTLQNAIQNARLSAVKNKADVFVQLDRANGEYRVYLDNTGDAANRGSLDSGDFLTERASAPDGVAYTELFGATPLVAQFTFDVRGFSNTSGEIHLKNNNDTYKGVALTLAGSSRIIISGDGSTWQ